MFELEIAIRDWKRKLARYETIEDAFIVDLELHLRDAFAAQKSLGLSDEDAFRAAEAQVGEAESFAAEMGKNRLAALDRRSPLRPSRFMPALLANYFRVAARRFKRQKGYSFLNIAGLAVGMAAGVLILMWVRDETSFDRFHVHAGAIQRVIVERTIQNTFRTPGGPGPLGPFLRDSYPEVVDAVRLRNCQLPLRYGKGADNFYAQRGIIADPSIFKMFSFPFRSGDPASALTDPSSIVITESMAKACFRDEDPMGKVLFDGPDSPMRVTGVIKDLPANSVFKFHYVIPLSFLAKGGQKFDRWDAAVLAAYIQLTAGTDPRAFNAKIERVVSDHVPGLRSKVILIPLSKLHLYGIDGQGPITFVVICSIVALFVLLIACINFVNLATARSAQRAREVGLRKVIGAQRTDLIRQFLGEALVHVAFALLAAVGLVLAALPAFNRLSGKSFRSADLFGPSVLLGVAGMAVFTGLMSGVYPAFVLSRFQPVRVLRGAPIGGAGQQGLRRILVVAQFSISAFLLVGTLVVSKQLQFIRNKDLGLDSKNLVVTSLGDQTREAFEALKADLKNRPGIAAVTRSNADLTFLGFETSAVTWEGKQAGNSMTIQIRTVDYDYLEAMGMRMKEGRFFSRNFPTDATEGVVVNEAALRVMGMEKPLDKEFVLSGKRGRIIGVVRDFHHHSLHDAIEPLVFIMNDDSFSYLFVRLAPGRTAEGLETLRTVWPRVDPGYPFSYRFFVDALDGLYRSERQTGEVVRTFAALALLISCFGLFGLAAFLAERKTKEIGIRKVAGASVPRIVALLNKEFLKWVIVADMIGLPVAWFLLNKWLRGFAYRTSMGAGIYILAVVLSLGIAGLTVSFQSVKAGRANPIDAIRFE